MPRWYLMDEQNKTLTASNNAGHALKRQSDARTAVYGGGRDSDELTYLRNQNSSGSGVDTHIMDAWDTFAGAQGVTSTTRPTEKRNLFFRTQDYP